MQDSRTLIDGTAVCRIIFAKVVQASPDRSLHCKYVYPHPSTHRPCSYFRSTQTLTITIDKSFLAVDSLTPSSSGSGSRTHSPATPKDGQPLETPSSAYNINCAFPLFQPARKSHYYDDSPTIPQSYISGIYASRPPYSPALPPSPTPLDARSLMAKINAITPGPFGPKSGSNDKGSEHNPVVTRFPDRSSSRMYSVDQTHGREPVKSREHGHGEGRDYGWKESQQGDPRGDSASAVPRMLESSESIADPSHGARAETLSRPQPLRENPAPQSLGRSNNFPDSVRSSGTVRAPPHPGIGLPRTPSQFRRNKNTQTKELPAPPAPPAPPTRGRSPPSRQLAPSSTNRNGGSQAHAATLSVSSSSSSALSHLSKSSMSSPPASEISETSRLKGPQFVDPKILNHDQHKRPVFPNSIGEEIDNLMHDLHFPQPDSQVTPPSVPSTHDRDVRRPSKSTAGREMSPSAPLKNGRNARRPSRSTPDNVNSRFRVPPPLSKSPSPPPIDPPSRLLIPTDPPSRHATPTDPPSRHATPIDPPSRHATPNRGHKRTLTSRGRCRGCGEQIIGKSISSADGRLSGRYHKACFACQMCRRPFQSAEFYVLDNLPYCHHHYHQLNNSLCGVCSCGIEGPCLETVQKERFHPGCFTCVVRFPETSTYMPQC